MNVSVDRASYTLCFLKEIEYNQNYFLGMYSQVAIEKTHAAVVQTRQRSSALLMAKHYSPEQVMEIESNVTKRWEKLVTCAEDR